MEKSGSPDSGAGPNHAKKAEGAEGAEAAGGGSSQLLRWLPPAYRQELYQVLRLTGPLVSPWIRCSYSVATVFHSDATCSSLKRLGLTLCSKVYPSERDSKKNHLFVPAAAVQDPQLLASIRYHHICWTYWQRGAGWICFGLSGNVFAWFMLVRTFILSNSSFETTVINCGV